MEHKEKLFATIDELAEATGKTRSSIEWAIHNGTAPPSAKIMGRRVFRWSDVYEWIDQQFAEQNPAA